jgi:hypothetical protein
MTNLEFVKGLRGKKLKELTPSELKRVKAFVKNERINKEENKGFAQFRRAVNNKNNNYTVKLSDLRLPTEIEKDKSGKFTYTKEGKIKIKRK